MHPHQERVVEEKQKLDEKIEKLEAFLDTEIFNKLDSKEQLRLSAQLGYMKGYQSILWERIMAF